jgi:AsmA family protein
MNPAGRRRWPWVLAAGLAAVVMLLALGEERGWPFLAKPAERWLTRTLDRRVQLGAPDAAAQGGARVRLFGGLTVSADLIEIAAPEWSSEPYLLRARDARIRLRYSDLWRVKRGERLRVARLEARELDARLERPDAQRASWQFRPRTVPADADRSSLPIFERLLVRDGRVTYEDKPRRLDLQVQATLSEGGSSGVPPGLHATATGHSRGAALRIQLDSDALLPWVEGDTGAAPVALRIAASSGASRLSFDGTARDAFGLDGLLGRFMVEGASLSQLGDALGVTLPTTQRFRLDGRLAKEDTRWSVLVDAARVGASRLAGELTYDSAPVRPLLAGRLSGSLLQFADLGPAVGAPVPGVAPAPKAGRVIPDREFDLPSLRAMDANVLVNLDKVNLGSAFGEPLQPLRTHLKLTNGVLVLDDLETSTSQGRMRGRIELDGRTDAPLWHAQLRWADVALERLLRQQRKDGQPPFVSGRLAGRADVKGRGRSTAQMLSTLDGEIALRLRGGTVSHLAIEAAGVDIAESLGVLIKGDDSLPVTCAVGQWVARGGVVRPRVMVLDTRDSTVWIDGSLSLASEQMDLRAIVAPKDFSPLALRTPLRVTGRFTAPRVSLDKGPLVRKLAITGLLAALQPLAAILPLIDTGGSPDGEEGEAGCERLIRLAGAPNAPAKIK